MTGLAMMKIGEIKWIKKEKPHLGPLDALVAPLALAPCTSDIHTVWQGALGERSNMILGHEAIGKVVEVGSGVKDFKPGDRVVVPAITPDWDTLEIQQGRHQHSGGMLAGWKFSNIKDGVFGEFFHVNHADMNLAHLPEEIPLEAAVMMPDMMTTGIHGAELADIHVGDTVAVLGIGPVGLMSVAGARIRGAGRIIAVGNRPATVEAAKSYGATDIVNYKEGPVHEQILELTKNKGVDATIIAGGNADILDTAVKITVPGGTIGNVNYFGEGEFLPVPRLEWGVGMSHKTIKGGLTPGGRLRMEKMIALVQNKRIDPGKMATHVMKGFENIERAILLMKDKPDDLIKPVVLV
ncbi:MAG TPA: NAD(P)-dependent alcohol dehydrogenase [Firmicutes bacterium]|nr:NAD(P)-dependent alcohol dehydrogenase [Bacillota bacterium]